MSCALQINGRNNFCPFRIVSLSSIRAASMQIYIHREGQQFGPYSVEEAKEHLAAGSLRAADMAWHEGMADWMPLAQLEGMAPAAAPTVPKPVQMTQPSWIPPKRTGDSSPTVRSVVSAAPAPAAPITTSDGAVRSSRKSSSKNPITQRQRAVGVQNMGLGALWFIGGSAVTLFSYEAAAETPGGGHYFLAWGAIIFGGIQFVKGVIQYCQA